MQRPGEAQLGAHPSTPEDVAQIIRGLHKQLDEIQASMGEPAHDGGAWCSRLSLRCLALFSGEDATFPVERWIARVEEAARVHRWSEHEILFAAKYALTGAAAYWLNIEKEATTWTMFRYKIIDAFRRRATELNAIGTDRPEKGESLLRYCDRVGGISDKSILRFFANAVEEDTRAKVLLDECKTFEEFKTKLIVSAAMKQAAAKSERRVESNNSSSALHRSSDNKSVGLSGDKCLRCEIADHLSLKSESKVGKPFWFKCEKSKQFKNCTPIPAGAVPGEMEALKSANYLTPYGENDRRLKSIELEGINIVAVLDLRIPCNVLREDVVWKKIVPSKTMGLRWLFVQQSIKIGDKAVTSKSKIVLETVLDGTVYKLEYIVVPENTMNGRVIIGNPLTESARVRMDRGCMIIEPLPEPTSPSKKC